MIFITPDQEITIKGEELTILFRNILYRDEKKIMQLLEENKIEFTHINLEVDYRVNGKEKDIKNYSKNHNKGVNYE